MKETVKDLEQLETMLESIQNTELKSQFSSMIESVYLDIYQNQLNDEERFKVDMEVRTYDLSLDGWEHETDIYEPDGWICKLYQHTMWGHWLVETWGLNSRLDERDARFDTEPEAYEYARYTVNSKNRPWG